MERVSEVMAVQQEGRDRSALLHDVWRQAGDRGWLPGSSTRVAIQVGQAHRSQVVVDTARSLAGYLARERPVVGIEVFDSRGDEWGSLRTRDLVREDSVRIVGVALPRGVTIPSAWYESLFLVTITGVGADWAARLCGVLSAQAEVLHRLANPSDPEALWYEAHRLAASNLAVACGDEGGGWWAIGADEVAVDQALAMAAGVPSERLPCLRALARHEVPLAARVVGTLPSLQAAAAPAAGAVALAAGRHLRASGRRLREDVAGLRRNLHRVPLALKRRLAALRRRRQGA